MVNYLNQAFSTNRKPRYIRSIVLFWWQWWEREHAYTHTYLHKKYPPGTCVQVKLNMICSSPPNQSMWNIYIGQLVNGYPIWRSRVYFVILLGVHEYTLNTTSVLHYTILPVNHFYAAELKLAQCKLRTQQIPNNTKNLQQLDLYVSSSQTVNEAG